MQTQDTTKRQQERDEHLTHVAAARRVDRLTPELIALARAVGDGQLHHHAAFDQLKAWERAGVIDTLQVSACIGRWTVEAAIATIPAAHIAGVATDERVLVVPDPLNRRFGEARLRAES